MGFTGITVSDYTAIEELYTVQGMAADKAAAGVLAFKSGVDMELPEPSTYPSLVEAVRRQVRSPKRTRREVSAAYSQRSSMQAFSSILL